MSKIFCLACGKLFEDYPDTLFTQITQSPEVLAEASMYQNYIGLWCSPFIQWGKDTKSEAIAATVVKLKEVTK